MDPVYDNMPANPQTDVAVISPNNLAQQRQEPKHNSDSINGHPIISPIHQQFGQPQYTQDYPPQYQPSNYNNHYPFFSQQPPSYPQSCAYSPQHQQLYNPQQYFPQQEVDFNGQQLPPPPPMPAPGSRMSFLAPIVLSCFVFWICGVLFGAVAFALAIFGQESARNSDTTSARRMYKASYTVSISGIVVGLIIVVTFATVIGIRWSEWSTVPYKCPYNAETCNTGFYYYDNYNCKFCCTVSEVIVQTKTCVTI